MTNTIESVFKYIVEFLLGEDNKELARVISYGENDHAEVIIVPSGFFDEGVYMTSNSKPAVPIETFNGIPVLFGRPCVEKKDDKIYIYMDLIASSFFFISRYEECIYSSNTDVYGRYIGKGSFSYKYGLLDRPVVDEYSELLISIMKENGYEVVSCKKGLRHVYLTHDIDNIWSRNSFLEAVYSSAGRLLKKKGDIFRPLKEYWNYENYDPIFTFPMMAEIDNRFKARYKGDTSVIYFTKGNRIRKGVDESYIQKKRRLIRLINNLSSNRYEIQYHMSYIAANNPEIVKRELKRLEELTPEKITKNRNHYLASRIPEGYEILLKNGIKEDFTMSYHDVIGFRLGTCRPVQWINPYNKRVTSLLLHPLTVMECTLYADGRMGIKSEEAAFEAVKAMLDISYDYGGEVSLLWHNNSFAGNDTYYKELYINLLDYIEDLYRSI